MFVLCAVRSGSTLLRFVLDAHPQLGCPPETDLPALCAQLASTSSLLAGQPRARGRDGRMPAVSEPVLDTIRAAMAELIGPYLARRGKIRYCDKSLFSAQHADLLSEVFPWAKFICLYRHPMDVIASCIEACPWGLRGFGLDSYAAAAPGNAVLAGARFWSDHASAILNVEERHPDRCHRVRYEDLVAEPEAVADGIFRFLGVPSSPGVTARCFAPERERLGPADYKIWQTSRITADSVGRGWSIPASLIDPPTAAALNELAGRLGYLQADQAWGLADVPPELRVRGSGGVGGRPARAGAPGGESLPRAYALLGHVLQQGLFRISPRFAARWGSCSAESFLIVATAPDSGGGSVRWLVNLANRSVTVAGRLAAGQAAASPADRVAWQLTGSAATWERVLGGTANLNVALRRRELRYSDTGETDPATTVRRVSMLADLLGIVSWRSAVGTGPASAPSAA